ncbi:hypothetical protein ACOWXJ_24015, partial [Klebsiella pneumoniae]
AAFYSYNLKVLSLIRKILIRIKCW